MEPDPQLETLSKLEPPKPPPDPIPVFRLLCYLFRRDKAKAAWFRFSIYLVAVTLLSYFIAALTAIGQIAALGFDRAVTEYWAYWLVSPCWGAFFVLAILCLVLSGELLDYISLCIEVKNPEKAAKFKRRFFYVMILSAVVGLLFICALGGYKNAQKKKSDVSKLNSSDFLSIAKVASQQQQAVASLSDSANRMLDSLTGIQVEIENAKRQLNFTVSDLSKQEQQAAAANNRVKDLSKQEDDLNAKLQEVEAIVGGKKIITMDDLIKTNREGEISGAIIGLLVAIVGSFLYERLQKLFKAKTP